jgi:hypothetical protein
MDLFVCWLLFPVVLGALSLACGLLVERAAAIRLPGTLLLPVGLALVLVTAQFAVLTGTTAELATPAVVALAVLGVALSRPRLLALHPDWWALGAAAGVFASFAAPVVLSGEATFTGYLRLDDTSTWFGITDHVMEHGRSLQALAPSTYERWLDIYLSTGYPVGAFLPLGVGKALVGEDVAWVFQPYVSFLAAMLALGLYQLSTRVVASGWVRTFVVFIASQPAILFGYALVGGVKEVLTVSLLAAVAGLALPAARLGGRAMLPLAVVTAALFAAVSFGAAVWLLPLLLPALFVALRQRGRDAALLQAGVFTALAVALSLGALPAVVSFLDRSTSTLTSGAEFGSLLKSLSPLQLFGIWPVGDFRLNPNDLFIADVLIVIVIVCGLAGLVLAWRSKAPELPIYVVGTGLACLVIALFGGPWVDGKAFAIASPAFVFAALSGIALMMRWHPTAGLLGAAIAFGVLWSNLLAYHDTNLAPRDRLTELETIGKRIDGKGPTLLTQYELYGTRHFLRKGDPEGASQLGRRRVPTLSGKTLPEGDYEDIDGFRLDGLLPFRSLVLGRSPTASRPPSAYRLVWHGHYYELWQRDERPRSQILEHLPLGGMENPASKPSCAKVRELAGLPSTTRLAFVRRPRVFVLGLAGLPHPRGWQASFSDPGVLFPLDPGTMTIPVRTSQGRYGFWIGSAFRRRLELFVDGRRIGKRTHELQLYRQFVPMGDASLTTGNHVIVLRYGGAALRPGTGTGNQAFPFGPLSFSESTAERAVSYLRPSSARKLCREKLDWVEALGPAD